MKILFISSGFRAVYYFFEQSVVKAFQMQATIVKFLH